VQEELGLHDAGKLAAACNRFNPTEKNRARARARHR
jgi:hypothetical protein